MGRPKYTKKKRGKKDDFQFEKQMETAIQTNNKRRASFKADPELDMDDQKLLNFHEDIYPLTSDDAKSSDSEHVHYEHVRLKSVHERKATPHNLSTPKDDDDNGNAEFTPRQ